VTVVYGTLTRHDAARCAELEKQLFNLEFMNRSGVRFDE